MRREIFGVTASGGSTILQENSTTSLAEPPSQEDSSVSVAPDNLLKVLWRERFLIGAFAVGSVVIAAIYLLIASPIYTSTARMSVTLAGSRLTGQQSFTESVAATYLVTERELILSPAVLSLAAQSQDVRPYLKPDVPTMKFFQEGLSVEVGKHDTVISVSFMSPDREAAAKIANAIVGAYTAYQTRPKPADTAELERLSGERAKLDETMGEKSRQMYDLEQKYGVLTVGAAEGSLAERQLGLLSQELHAAHLDTLKLQVEHDDAEAAAKASNPQDGETPDALLPVGPDQEALIRTQILGLESKLQDLRSHYLPQHPYIQTVERDIAQMRVIYARAVERQYQVAAQREKDLQTAFDSQQKRAIEVSAATAQYLRLQSDVDASRKTVEQIDNRRREVEMSRDLGMLNIDPFERAVPELKASHPNKLFVLGLGLLLGLMFGCSSAFVHDWMDDRFRTIDEVRTATRLPLLGILPRIPEGMTAGIVGQQALLDPLSPAAEACRMIRTAIHFGAPLDRRRTALITSPSSGEGKSTMAANLAITTAQSGKRVLLIDADLRMPTQHRIFHVENYEGLSGVLQGRATLQQAVQPTDVDGLTLLPAGLQVHNPAEMLNSPMFAELLDLVFEQYDQVIIDSPPVVGLADARIIAASCDVTILVLRSGVSTRRTTELARQGLGSVGAQVLGAIVNDASESSLGAYSYYNGPRVRPARRAVESRSLSNVGD